MFTTSSIRKTLTPSRRSLHNHPSPSPNGYVDLHLHSWETAGRTGDRVVPPLLRSYDERHAWRNARRDSNHQAHHLPLLLRRHPLLLLGVGLSCSSGRRLPYASPSYPPPLGAVAAPSGHFQVRLKPYRLSRGQVLRRGDQLSLHKVDKPLRVSPWVHGANVPVRRLLRSGYVILLKPAVPAHKFKDVDALHVVQGDHDRVVRFAPQASVPLNSKLSRAEEGTFGRLLRRRGPLQNLRL